MGKATRWAGGSLVGEPALTPLSATAFYCDPSAMQPTQIRQPFHRNGWVYEEKIDGWRMLACKDGRTGRLESRNGVDHTRRFPDLAADVAALPERTLVLDREVAVFDRQLRSRFD